MREEFKKAISYGISVGVVAGVGRLTLGIAHRMLEVTAGPQTSSERR